MFLPKSPWRPIIFGQKLFISPSFAFAHGISMGASVSTTFIWVDFSLDVGFGIIKQKTRRKYS